MKQISEKEITILYRARDILSRYTTTGGLSQTYLENYEKSIAEIINSNGEVAHNIDNNIDDGKYETIPEEQFITEPYYSEVKIIKYIGFDDKHIRIPQFIKGRRVAVLAVSAFTNVSNLVSVIIPEGVRIIEDKCFYNCKMLSNIVFPDTLKRIGEEAFLCTGLV